MAAFKVSTVSANVTLDDLGITMTHPATDRDLSLEFNPYEIAASADLTAAISGGTLTLKLTSDNYGEYSVKASEYYSQMLLEEDFLLTTREGLVTEAELAAGSLNSLINASATGLTITSTASATKNIFVTTGTFQKWGIGVGDKAVITGGAAAGTYTVAIITDQTQFRVSETIADTAGVGTLAVYHPIGATKVGTKSSWTNLAGSTVDALLTSIDDEFTSLGVPASVSVADAASDTTTWVLLAGTAATGTNAVLSDASLTYNSSTNNLSTTTFTGALSGNATTSTTATNITIAASASTTGSILFTESATGNLPPKSDAGLTYNASTNALTTTTFIGALSGNATTATSLASGAAGQLHYQTGSGTSGFVTNGTSGQFLKSAASSSPVWSTLVMSDIPGASYKQSVRAATTANVGTGATNTTITGISNLTLDTSVTLAANDRVLVKNQTSSQNNGIYYVSTLGTGAADGTWTRTAGADSSADIASAIVNIDEGTTLGGTHWANSFKATDTLGTAGTAMTWTQFGTSGGSGDVVGPASSTDNAVARFDSTTGKIIQNSGVIIDDSNNIGTTASLLVSGTIATPQHAISVGDNIGISGFTKAVSVTGTTNGALYGYLAGQGVSNNLQVYWTANTTAASASARINTFGYSNPIYIDASDIFINNVSGKKTFLGNVSSKGASVTLGQIATENNIGGTTTANASTTITGVGTAFLTKVGIGDQIALSSATGTLSSVTAIASDTSLTVASALGNGTSQTINVQHAHFSVHDAAGGVDMVMNHLGNLGLGTVDPLLGRIQTANSNAPGLVALSGSSGAQTSLNIGRTATEIELAISGAPNNWSTGTVAGDGVLRMSGSSNKLHLSANASGAPIITMSSTKVGVGTITPDRVFHVKGNVASENLDYVLKLQASLDTSVGTSGPGILFLSGPNDDRGKGAIAWLGSGSWNRGDIAFLNKDSIGVAVDIPTASDAVLRLPSDMGAPAVGEVMQAINTNGRVNWRYPWETNLEAQQYSWGVFEDFIGTVVTSNASTADGLFVVSTVNAGAAGLAGTSATNAPGVQQLTTGTTSTGSATLFSGGGSNGFYYSSGITTIFEARVRIPVLPVSGGENFTVTCGLLGAANEYVRFSFTGGGTGWVMENSDTAANTTVWGTTVTANTWYRLRAVITTSSVQYYINGTLTATHSTAANIPNSIQLINIKILKSNLATARTFDIDYVGLTQHGYTR